MDTAQGATVAAPESLPQQGELVAGTADGVDRPKLVTPTADEEGTANALGGVNAESGAASPQAHPRRPDEGEIDADSISKASRDATAEAKKSKKTDYMKTSVDQDAMAAFKLRAKTSDTKGGFWDLWKVMEDLKWKYVHASGKYISPTGDEFSSAKELTAYLDRFSMPSRGCTPTPCSDDEARRGRRLRDDLLEAVFKYNKHKSSKKRKVSSSGSTADWSCHHEEKVLFDLDFGSSPMKDDRESSNDTSSKRQSERKSAASIDPGVQMCFQGTKASRTKKRQAKKADTTENVEKPSYQVWPDPETCVKEVKSLAESGTADADVIAGEAEYQRHFADWRFLLDTNHSLLLYGLGSKRTILEEFGNTELRCDGEVLTLDGYDRSISIDQILDVIVHCYLGGTEPHVRDFTPSSANARTWGLGITPPHQGSPQVVKRASAIAERIAAKRLRPLLIVLHSIDGIGLRFRVAQAALAALVAGSAGADGTTRMIRIAASIDHVNASALLWDTHTVTSFAWVWKETRTYRPYYEEVRLSAEGPSKKAKFAQGRLSGDDNLGFLRVLQSLGPRNAECLQTLARLQLKVRGSGGGNNNKKGPSQRQRQQQQQQSSSSSSSSAVSYREWKAECFRKMCATDDASLRLVLKELVDHGIVEEKQAANERDGTDRVWIPHRPKVLDQILRFSSKQD